MSDNHRLAETEMTRLQLHWDTYTDPEYVRLRDARQAACAHNSLFDSGLCVLCGKWTKGKP